MKIEHDVVKLRPFAEASSQSREKAKHLGLCSVDIYKKRPKTSMVAANRMLNRALGIRSDGEKRKHSSNKVSTTVNDGASNSVDEYSFSSGKGHMTTQNASASIAANRMLNRALGIKGDSKLKSSSRNFETRTTYNSDSNKGEQILNEVSDKRSGRNRHTRNNYDASLAANRMFKRALGSPVTGNQTSTENRSRNNK